MHQSEEGSQRSPWQRIRALLGRYRRGKPILVRTDDTLELRFARSIGQSRMALGEPDWLLIDYTRTMLGALLLQPEPRRIGIVGVGGGSQLKFCHRHLPQARIDGFEIDPRVLALRREFRIPDDDARLQLHRVDASHALPRYRAAFDLLLVDAYDPRGIPAALSTQAFYDDCRAALADNGVYAGNLYATDFSVHVSRLRRSFEHRVVLIDAPGDENRVVLAWTPQLDARIAQLDLAQALTRFSQRARLQLQPAFERVAAALGTQWGSA